MARPWSFEAGPRNLMSTDSDLNARPWSSAAGLTDDQRAPKPAPRERDGPDVRTASFDLSRCEQEAIAFCGAVQPFGCLLVLDAQTLKVLACSGNTAHFLGRDPEGLLGMTVAALLPADDGGLLDSLQAAEVDRHFCPTHFQMPAPAGDLSLHIRSHAWRGRLLLEIEFDAPPTSPMAMDQRLARFDFAALQARMMQLGTTASVCHEAVDALRHLSGFERVLAYRLEPDANGLVVAESLLQGAWPSVLGLRYPASEIPRQARALYTEAPIRYAPCRDYADVPLLAHGLAPGAIDIGIAQVRAQSPIHRAYLEHFNVNGSMSLSSVHQGRLWGLLIFHHRAPHPVTPAMRRRLIEFAGFLSARLTLLEEQSKQRARDAGVGAVNRIVGDIDIKKPFPLGFQDRAELLRELVDADGVQIFHREEPLFGDGGLRLSSAEIQALLSFLRTRDGPVWSTDCLSGEFEPAAAYPRRLAGVMAVFVNTDRERIVLFGRRRSEYRVRWGSDPAPLPFSRVQRVHPFGWANRSFQVWNEERTHYAKPWSAVELAIGDALRDLIQQVIVASAAHFEALTLRDALTGLCNREQFRRVLAETVQACRADSGVFGVGVLDIDHFKIINDTHGHDMGDLLLQVVAQRIAAALPTEGTAARLGGDEFALLLPPGHEDALDAMPERVIAALREPILIGEEQFVVTASMGISLGHGGSECSALLKQADLSLYQAKAAGRDRVWGFDSGMHQRALERMRITREVLGGDPGKSVELWLQPQVPIAAPPGRRRYEVLTRWRAADGTLLMPSGYIASAEHNGIIRAVTAVVIRQSIALLQQQLRADETGGGIVLAVNVSAADLDEARFARRLLDDLDRAGVPPDRLEVEITESRLLQMTPALKTSLDQLARGGVSLALDDFGSGFSSLTHLRELPISTLKIDRSFITGVTGERDRRLVAGIIGMAHSLGKQVVAEGIEQPEQLEVLRVLGCDWGQGFLWARPVLPEQALAFSP